MSISIMDRKRVLGEENLREWDQLYCLVHDDDLVMCSRIKDGKVIKFLGFKENKQTGKTK